MSAEAFTNILTSETELPDILEEAPVNPPTTAEIEAAIADMDAELEALFTAEDEAKLAAVTKGRNNGIADSGGFGWD